MAPCVLALLALFMDALTTPSASPSASPASGPGGVATGAGLVVFVLLIGGMFMMRNRLLRR